MAMKVAQVLRMKEGTSDSSYANASYIPKQVLLSTKSMRDEAIKEFYQKHCPTTLCIADLGCSSAEQNTLTVVIDLMETVEMTRQQLGYRPHDYQVHLNDLPKNDFNALFRTLETFNNKLVQKFGDEVGHCFVYGVPGSFYGRLFPDNSLHFVHSSYSVHWLSQEPTGIEENKENIYLTKTSSKRVANAYYEQFAKNFSTFLRCRSKEVIQDGKMVLTLVGRQINDSFVEDCSHVWDLLATVLKEMASEGLIERKELNTFNIPIYYPSSSELKLLVEREGSFNLNRFHTFETKWNNIATKKNHDSYDFMKCMRSVAETMLVNHFREVVIDEIFLRYQKAIQLSMTKEDHAFINHSMSFTKK